VTSDIYVENGVGRAVMEAINLFTPKHGVTAHWQHDIHPQMQRKQNGDEWWIADIASRDMAILTQDRAILDDPEERQTVVEQEAKLIAFGKADYSTWQKLRCVVTHWDSIEDLLNAPGPQAVTLFLTEARVETF
jgi:hypothetical protein